MARRQSAPDEAKALWQRYLDAHDGQQGMAPEYVHHEQMFPMLSRRANEFIARPSGSATLPETAAKKPAP